MVDLTPKVSVPTGFESQVRSLAQRRKLADALMEQGLAGGQNYGSWAQVLGQLAQAWAGKSIGKEVDRGQTALDGQILSKYTTDLGNLNADAKTMNPGDLVAKYGSNPYLADALKPYQSAMTSRMEGDQRIVNNGGHWDRAGSVVGTYEHSKPTDHVIRLPNGQLAVNPVAIAAANASQGLGYGGFPAITADPNAMPSSTPQIVAGDTPPHTSSRALEALRNVPHGSPLSPARDAPQPGMIQDGYIFLGGDPGDQNNWRAQ